MAGKRPDHHGVVKGTEERDYSNETIRLLMERASLRDFTDTPVSDEVLNTILEAGCHAATGGNLQPYSVIVIRDAMMREKLAKMCWQKFMAKAPVHLLFCIDWHRNARWAKLSAAPFDAQDSFRHLWISFQDTMIFAQTICTAADALGLGSVYIGTIMEYLPKLPRMFGLPKRVLPVVLLCLGYPASKPSPRLKLPPGVIAHNEKYTDAGDADLMAAYERKYPDKRIEITPDRMARLAETCCAVNGEKFAQQCMRKTRTRGYLNAAQHLFGLHYTADEMTEGNRLFMDAIRKMGFGWFDEASEMDEKNQGEK
jgi:nitroreductase